MDFQKVIQNLAYLFASLIIVFFCSLLVLGIVSVWREIV